MKIEVTNINHTKYTQIICDTIAESAAIRGTGIAKRDPNYINAKIENGNAVIALEKNVFAGFCYIETWSNGNTVANSGLIVHPNFRGIGLANDIKVRVFKLTREKFPDAKIISITTGPAVMKMNSKLGYKPVPFSDLTDDSNFWKGCQTCKNFDVLIRTDKKMCLCTGMLYEPKNRFKGIKPIKEKTFLRLKSIKETLFLKKEKQTDE